MEHDPLRCPTCDSRQPNLHPAAGDGGEVTKLCPDAFHDAPVVVLPGVVIRTPEEIADETAKLVPYEKADRTPAGPLQQLEQFTARWRGLDVQRLVSLLGAVTEHGSVALFAYAEDRAAVDVAAHYVSSYDERTGRFGVASRFGREAAERAYNQRLQELS